MFNFFRLLFSTNFMPHVYCLRDPGLIALHAISDAIIALSYFLIPAALWQLVRRRRDLMFPRIFTLFGIFILGCGSTHVLGVITLWEPVYRLDGLLKAVTAVASLGTAILLFRLLPQMLLIPSPERLREEIRERERSEREVRQLNELLEQRVEERTHELEEANRQLTESELRMRSILDEARLLIFVKDLEGRFTFVNRDLTERLEMSRETLIGHTVEEIFPEELARSYAENDRFTMAAGASQFEEIVEQSDGTAVYITSKFPLLNQEGQAYGLCGLSMDITERKRAEEGLVRLNRELGDSEERFRKIAELVPDMLWSAEVNGRTRFISQRFLEYTGIGEEEFRVADWRKVVHPAEVEALEQHFVSASAGGQPWECEVRLRCWDGSHCWFMSRTVAVFNDAGEIDYWLGSFNDIDEIKRTAHALRRSNEELDQIAYAAAHDLQEPMRNVSLSLGMLKVRFGPQFRPEETDWVEEGIKNARRMQGMVKDLLQYSRVISEGERAAEPTNTRLAAEHAIRNLDEAVRESEAQLEIGELPDLPVREPHLVMLFENLIANSLKYRKPETPPVIRITASASGGSWQFAIADNGIGFDAAYADRIFKVFKRLHNRDEYAGNGIGLAVCARIVAHYGGRIWAEAQPGQGAIFRFTFKEQA